MNLHDLQDFALSLMRSHGLDGWGFGFDRATRRAGLCNYTHQKITVSRKLMQLYPEHYAKDTVIHEVAHAIAGKEAGHGPVWQRIARELGGTGAPLISADAPQVPPKYLGYCACGRQFKRMRRPRPELLCAACAQSGRTGQIEWHTIPARTT